MMGHNIDIIVTEAGITMNIKSDSLQTLIDRR